MISYQSPHIRFLKETPFISKLQSTGTEPLIPECDNTSSCGNLGVVNCGGGNPTAVTIVAFLPHTACNEAPACTISDITQVNSPSHPQFSCGDPSLQNCGEDGCELTFVCDLPSVDSCLPVTAELSCPGIEVVTCANNVTPS